MPEETDHTINPIGLRFTKYCDKTIISILFASIVIVVFFFDVRLNSVYDLSKVTVLYISTFTILSIWSIKGLIMCWLVRTETYPGSSLPGYSSKGPSTVGWGNTPFHPAQPLNLPIISTLIVSGLATVFSIYPYISIIGIYTKYEGFVSIITYIILFYVVVNFIEKRRLNLLLNVIIMTAGMASIYGVFQHFGLDHYHWSVNFNDRVFSTFGNPIFFSAFLIMTIPLVFIKIFSNPGFRSPSYFYIVILALITVTFYYTKTRSCFLGLIVSNLFFFSLIGKKVLLANKTKTIATLTILIGISVFYNLDSKTSVIGRFFRDIRPDISAAKPETITNMREDAPPTEQASTSHFDHIEEEFGPLQKLKGTTFIRIFTYKVALKIIYDYPVLGIGPDTLAMIYPQYVAKIFDRADKERFYDYQDRVHNDFLEITVTRGFLGLGVYVWFIFVYSRMVWRGCKKTVGPDKILIIGLCSSCLAYFIQNQFAFGHIPIITLFWFLIGMSVIASPFRPSQSRGAEEGRGRTDDKLICTLNKDRPILVKWTKDHTAKRLAKSSICITVLCLSILIITLNISAYKADLYFINGYRLPMEGPALLKKIEDYKMAIKHNPWEINYLNSLNTVYIQKAVASLKNKPAKTDGSMADSPAYKQTEMWLSNAISGAKEVQDLYPGNYNSAFILGYAYQHLGNITNKDTQKESIKYYKQAITSHPFMFMYRNNLASLYSTKGHYKEAVRELRAAIKIAPSKAISYINLSKIFIKDNERYTEALETLLEFTKKHPGHQNNEIHKILGYLYSKAEKWEEVLKQSEKSIRLNRGDLDAHKVMIYAYFKLNRYEDSRKICHRLLELAGPMENKYNEYAKKMLKRLSGVQVLGTANSARTNGD